MTTPVRTCVVCRSKIDPAGALRFVLDPSGSPAVDWSGTLPGRGAHACATRECLSGLRKGGLSRSFKTKVVVPAAPWPLDLFSTRTRKQQREMLGLAHRAGVLKSGGNVVGGLLQRGWARYLVLAADAGDRVARDWSGRAERRGVPVHRSLLDAEGIGAALGRTGPRSVAAVSAGGPSEALRKALLRGEASL